MLILAAWHLSCTLDQQSPSPWRGTGRHDGAYHGGGEDHRFTGTHIDYFNATAGEKNAEQWYFESAWRTMH